MAVHALDGVELVRVSATSGRVAVVAEPRSDLSVDGAEVTIDGAVLTIHGRSRPVEVRVPEGTAVAVGTNSGRVELTGSFGAVGVSSESGRVEVERASSVDVRTTSGSVDVGWVASSCRARTTSGTVTVHRTRDLSAHADSGRIRAEDAAGHVRVRTTSGRIDVGVTGPSDVAGETVDGRIVVELARGLGAAVDASAGSGRVDNHAPGGDDCRVVVRTSSGHIEVR